MRLFGDTMSNGTESIDLKKIFMGLQDQMIATLSSNRETIKHPGTKGDASELKWIEMLNGYLPQRYKVNKAFVVDCNGTISQQIDIVIYDQHYSPFLFHQDGAIYVPAESVYGVFEVKQNLNKDAVEYSGQKAESVRRLKRTSVPIVHAGGKYKPKRPSEIIAGLLTLGCDWGQDIDSKLRNICPNLNGRQQIDIGCSLQFGAFDARYGEIFRIETSRKEDSLIFFFLRLLSRLQTLGTIPAMDIAEYERALRGER